MNYFHQFSDRVRVFDGAMGTMLQEKGLMPGQLPESMNFLHPDWVEAVHTSYLDAGADVLETNTFGANAPKLDGSGHTVRETYQAAVACARNAIRRSGRDALVAASIGPSGKLLKPMGDTEFEDMGSLFGECAEAAQEAGADFLLIETFSDLYEAKAAILGAREHATLPIAVTLSFDASGRLLTGADATAAAALLQALDVDMIGLNCGLGPAQMRSLVEQFRQVTDLPILVNPNAGLPRVEAGRTVYDLDPDSFAQATRELALAGAWMVGGCCGTTPAHIRRLAESVRGMTPETYAPARRAIVTSGCAWTEFGTIPVVIGERVNPTGKPKMKRALLDGDWDYILREGVAQSDAGADVLDVNVGLPGLDEPDALVRVMTGLQSVVTQPLQLDTADPVAMARAARLYNGRPLINSVNGKRAVMDAVFPILKKYGAMAVALALDESGVPETAQERLSIARRIADRAREYGISPDDLLFDPLVMTVSTDAANARVTLETLRLFKQAGYKTVMGVSNVSFGLPKRPLLNAHFLGLALWTGLDAAIVNPMNKELMDALNAHGALAGLPGGLDRYIRRFADEAPVKAPTAAPDESLMQCVLSGLKERAYAAAKRALIDTPPKVLIDRELIPALNQAGDAFQAKRMFLPQLLVAAEAAKSAFSAIREHMDASGEKKAGRGRILLATVEGDVHDIGKNIVRALLENYGYDVYDLGRDVPKDAVVRATLENGIPLVGLSALMTTTVGAMEATIAALRAQANVKIVVGGAVLTHDYAMQIGADFYAQDAMDTVRYAETFFQTQGR